MSYMPGALTVAMNFAAAMAPLAKTSRERAVCFISNTSSCPAKMTSCSPTMVPPRTEEMPISSRRLGRAARRVHLAAVVLFDDLDVEALAEHGGSALHELHHKVDAQRHVAGLEHRYPRRGLLDVVQLLLGVARRAQDDGYLPQQAELQQRVEVGGVGEVDDHVGGALVAHGVRIDLKAVLLERRAVEARDDLHTLEPLAAADNALAHVAVAAGDYYL